MSTREYHAFMSIQPMLAIQVRASSSLTTGASIQRFFGGRSRVETCTWKRGIHSGIPFGASFWKNALPYAPSG